MPKYKIKIKYLIMSIFIMLVLLIVGTIMFLQYKSSDKFAMMTTQTAFDRISDKVTAQIEQYDKASLEFINLSKNIKGIEKHLEHNKDHILFPVIKSYIENANYVYGIYLGYENDQFYIVYNLNLSNKMRESQKAPQNARWLIKQNIKENGELVSYKVFLDKDLNIVSNFSEPTSYRPTQRPWYKDAIKTNNIIKTKPYVFSAVKEPGVTYAQTINKDKGVVLSLDITISSLNRLLKSQELVQGSSAFIYNNDGKLIGQYDEVNKEKALNINDKYKDIFIKDNKVKDLGKQTLIEINGKEYLKYTTLLRNKFDTQEYLSIISPIDIIMEPYINKIYEILFTSLIILLVIVLPVIFYAVKIIVNSILRLQIENEKIAAGKFDMVKPVDSFMIEIADLSSSLVYMADSIEELTNNLEVKIDERTKELALQKENVEQILANILFPVFITSKKRRTILYANKYAQELYEKDESQIIGAHLDDVYTLKNGPESIIEEIVKNGRVNGREEYIKTHTGKEFIALLSVNPITYNDEECFIGVTTDITHQKEMENEVRAIHKHTRESIEYASLIQSAILPDHNTLKKYFKDDFIIWHPKDTVGGDIYFFDELRNQDECLLCFIDCTGHGVPGAFITILLKAIHQQIIAEIINAPDMEVSPAWIMSYFNKSLKKLLRQETIDSISNAGFDGGIIYYNKAKKNLKFAGAETPLFYVDTDNSFNTVKGNRYSVGYKKCDLDYEYKETVIDVKEGMKFYCTTDGYLDQNGGAKDFPFGKKRFGNIIKEYHMESMADQQEVFLEEMSLYESMIEDNDRNDDMTLIGLEI
ncbi:MAG: SpoIIE family protein phosphatase [Campylobacterota bacterium]|nr:SpoIIE family protein phosphatase [Campylobacterota bacterium]